MAKKAISKDESTSVSNVYKKKRAAAKSKPKSMVEGVLSFFKNSLLKLREELVEQIEDTSEDTLMKSQKDVSGDISGYGLHMADVATDNYDRDFNLNLVSNEKRLLFEIDEAIKRVENKTYGVCLSCNRYISKSRLKAIPYARYCTKCKRRLEQENKI